MENSRYKFRAWDKLRKLMFDIYDLGKEQSSSENGVTCPNSDLEIMQYTGLKDKNGVEIYEGDIVRFKNSEFVSVVSWCEDCWVVDVYDEKESLWVNQRDGDIEVIGNVFENGELLKY